MKRKRLLLFLCTGDTCRGPMASGYMRKVLEEQGLKDVDVKSAGVMTATGLLATPEAIQLLDTVQVDIRRHRSTQLTPELIRKADLVLGMTPFHVQFALRMALDAPDAREKIYLFKEFCGGDPKNYQITDPMGHTLEVYKRVFRELRQACEMLCQAEVVTGKKAAAAKKAAAPTKPATTRARPAAEKGKKSAESSSAGSPKKPATAKVAAEKPHAKKPAATTAKTKPSSARRAEKKSG